MKNYHHAEVTTTDQKLDRILELLESFKVPVVVHVTNPPNPIWPYEDKVGWPVSPSPTCAPQRFWDEHGVEIMPDTPEYNVCKAICDSSLEDGTTIQ